MLFILYIMHIDKNCRWKLLFDILQCQTEGKRVSESMYPFNYKPEQELVCWNFSIVTPQRQEAQNS